MIDAPWSRPSNTWRFAGRLIPGARRVAGPFFSALLAPLLSAFLAASSCCSASTNSPARTSSSNRPALAVLLVVDQMRADYLSRFSSRLSGGLVRLEQEGMVFEEAYQDYANTETASSATNGTIAPPTRRSTASPPVNRSATSMSRRSGSGSRRNRPLRASWRSPARIARPS